MKAIRKSVWSVVLLAMAAGCAGEPETATEVPRTTAKTNYPSPAPKDNPPAPAPKPTESKKGDEPPAVEGPKTDNATPDGKGVKLTAAELDSIKELPETEQAAAIAQAVCPVSAHHLGSMDKPVKVSAEGRTFYLCCEGCEDKLKSDPKGYVAKLNKK